MTFILENPEQIAKLLLEHLEMTGVAVAIAAFIAFPIAVLIHAYRWLQVPIFGILGTLYTIPSLALIVLLVPLFGLNRQSVIVAMVVYCQIILARNFVVALQSIDPAIAEAAKGMGMSFAQSLWYIYVPLGLPFGLAGVRLAAVVAVAIATIGAKFGAGGLGTLLFDGISQHRNDKLIAGTITVAVFAFALNGLLLGLEWLSDPRRKLWR